MIEVRALGARDAVDDAGLHIDLPATASAAFEGGERVASWGLAWGAGRCWLWFHSDKAEPRHATRLVRLARREMARARQLGETELYSPRDAEYPTSERLLRFLGFEFYADESGVEVWRCQLFP